MRLSLYVTNKTPDSIYKPKAIPQCFVNKALAVNIMHIIKKTNIGWTYLKLTINSRFVVTTLPKSLASNYGPGFKGSHTQQPLFEQNDPTLFQLAGIVN